MVTLNDANPRVLELIRNLNIRLLSFAECSLSGITIDPYIWQNSNGFYECHDDFIAFNHTPKSNIQDLNSCILHEIAHWSGHPTRLNRKAIEAGANLAIYELDLHIIHTEEVIAQLGMFKLACYLGLNIEKYLEMTNLYIQRYFMANRLEADIESTKALGFIIDRERVALTKAA